MPPYVLFSLGALTGAGIALLAPALARSGRPIAKEAIKLAVMGVREATTRAAELVESLEDLYAEATAETQSEASVAAAEASAAVARARAAAARPRKRGAARKAASRKAGAAEGDTE